MSEPTPADVRAYIAAGLPCRHLAGRGRRAPLLRHHRLGRVRGPAARAAPPARVYAALGR
jgi:hypothetical protein